MTNAIEELDFEAIPELVNKITDATVANIASTLGKRPAMQPVRDTCPMAYVRCPKDYVMCTADYKD